MEAWEALGPGLASKLTSGVTDLTLDFGPMLAVSGKILQGAHTEASLSALAEGIPLTYLNLLEFSVTIETICNKEWGDDQDDLDGHTTYKQWRVTEQIFELIIKVVDGSKYPSTLDITAILKDS